MKKGYSATGKKQVLVISGNCRDQCSQSRVSDGESRGNEVVELGRGKIGERVNSALFSEYHGRPLDGLKQGCDII